MLRTPSGEPEWLLAMVVDISARKRAEEELKALNETLEKKVAERTAAAEAKAEEMQHFAQIVSHDLQEPLRMVTSYLSLLERRTAGKLAPDSREFIEFAVDGARRMRRLLEDLLKYSRVGSRGNEPQPVSAEATLRDVLADLKLVIADSQAHVEHDPLPFVLADPVQLAQLLQNLIANAIKFRGDEPPVVKVRCEREGDWSHFSVADYGIGFDMQESQRIFEIFQRLHGREVPGTGVGLAICKKIVERHGGKIWAVSSPGKGATFHFTLPAASSSAGASPRAPSTGIAPEVAGGPTLGH
jgi:light-regulated signal transduction histidine kinase (bacteriophytochrome)